MQSFSKDFQSDLEDLFRWRRDVRRFRDDPVDEALLSECLATFSYAPSVGLSEPWRIIRLESDEARQAALQNFLSANSDALSRYSREKATTYAKLKLSGMKDAPVQIAVYCDETTSKGAGLGAATMPEMRRYSVVAAIMQFWLATRARGLGVGWVSILDPDQLNRDLGVPANWALVGYFCIGWPAENTETPELETQGWEARLAQLSIEVK